MRLEGLVGALQSCMMVIKPDVFEMTYVVDSCSIVAIDGLEGG